MTSVIYRHFMPFLVGFGVVTTVAGIQETPMAEYSMPQRRKRRKPNVKKTCARAHGQWVSKTSLVGGFKHCLFSTIIWDNPSQWLICFKMVKTTNHFCCFTITGWFLGTRFSWIMIIPNILGRQSPIIFNQQGFWTWLMCIEQRN